MKEEIIEKIEKFATRVMQGGENVSMQETAILPEMLKILQKETTENNDGQRLIIRQKFNKDIFESFF